MVVPQPVQVTLVVAGLSDAVAGRSHVSVVGFAGYGWHAGAECL